MLGATIYVSIIVTSFPQNHNLTLTKAINGMQYLLSWVGSGSFS